MESNKKHGIEPQTIRKAVSDIIQAARVSEAKVSYKTREKYERVVKELPKEEMIRLRDEIVALRQSLAPEKKKLLKK